MRLAAPVVLILAVAACSSEPGRVRKRECEAVLAHLTVLERGESDQPMCKYHPDCGGERADRYERSCTKVLGREEADCYLRATTLDDADDCLRRDVFDDAIRTGRKPNSSGRKTDDDDPWFRSGNDRSPLGQMKDIRDEACACKDDACAERIEKRIETWTRDNASASADIKPDDELMKVAMDAYTCMSNAKSGGAGGGYPSYGYYDANPYDYKDPYGWRSGSTGMPACDEYFELVDELMDCDAYPQASRDAMRDSVSSLKSAWGDPSSMSTSTRESTNDSCKMMVDGLEQSMSAIGCP